jgi:hypothetical protein
MAKPKPKSEPRESRAKRAARPHVTPQEARQGVPVIDRHWRWAVAGAVLGLVIVLLVWLGFGFGS